MDCNINISFKEVFPILDDEHVRLFSDAVVNSVTIDKTSCALLAVISIKNLCSDKARLYAEQVIRERFGLSKATLRLRYPETLLCNDYFIQLTERLRHDFPSISGFLAGSVWKFEDNTVFIELKNGDEVFFESCIGYIKNNISNEFGLSINVSLRSKTQSASESEQVIQMLHEKIIAEEPPVIEPPKPKPKQPEKKQGYDKTKFKKLKKYDGELMLGKPNFDDFIKIKDLTDEIGRISIEGDIFSVNHRENPARNLVHLSFDVTDYTGSVRIVKSLPMDDASLLMDKLRAGTHILVHGVTAYDMYLKDVVLRPQNILICDKKIRMDTSVEKRVELHLHTNMSAMDGMSSITDLAERAAKWGHKSMAVTDHGVLQAYPEAMAASKKFGIKVIYGVEAYFINNTSARIVTGGAGDSFDGEFVCFDIETTGLHARSDGITEIAAVILKNGEVGESYHTYVNPEMPIPRKITELTGITNDMVKNAPKLEAVLPEFLKFVNGRCLAAHNAEFDIGFMKAACQRYGISCEFKYIDTLEFSRLMLPNLGRHKLNVVAEELDLPKFTHHRATDDAATVAYMLKRFFDMLKSSSSLKNVSELNTYFSESVLNVALKSRPYHMIILVKNQVGLRNLYKLVSFSHLNYFHKRPLIPRTLLDEYREGLIVGSACEAGELYTAIIQGKPEQELINTAKYYDFLEIQPVGNNAFLIENGTVDSAEAIRNFNKTVMELADKLNLPLVATGDVHFLDPHDELYRRVLMAGMGFSDADKQAPLYLKTTNEMLEEFSYLGQEAAYRAVIENPNKIADLCEVIKPIPDGQYPPSIDGSKEELARLCKNRAHELYGEILPEVVQERMDYELSKIIGHDFDVMYIIAQKLVSKSISDGYLVGSRGSVGSSFAAFLSGITEVNALPPHYRCPNCKNSLFMDDGDYAVGADLPDRVCEKCGTPYLKDGFDIPFQTFLGFDGDKTPDIDLNFSGEYQARAHRQTIEIFGEGHVFRAGTIGTVKDKTAYGFAKKYLQERDMVVSKAEENRMSVGCTGIKRTTGQHPGGVMIVPKDREIYDFTPVQHPADKTESDIITTHFDYHSIHDNLLKLDLLGHDDPTMIRKLEELTGLNAREIPLDDRDTMSIFTSLKALGIKEDRILGQTGAVAIPEFGTKFVREMLLDTRPTTFDELIRISGLSHGTDVWLNNAQDLVKNKVANLKQVICARDDIMLYLISKGVEPKLSFTIMESVRKGKGLKPEWEEEMRVHSVPEWYLESCKKIKYMFPKAHAVAYVMMAFRIAWFKVHEPKAFYAAYFSIRARAFDASIMTSGDDVVVSKMDELSSKEKLSEIEKDMLVTLEVCHEYYLRGLTFEPIDLYRSDAANFIITEKGLLPPFTAIPGLGEVAARSIIAQREIEEFFSIDELQFRCEKVSKAVIELLVTNHVLDNIPKSSQISLF